MKMSNNSAIYEVLVKQYLPSILNIMESRGRGSVHSTREKFESAALLLRFSQLSTLIRHENGAFENTLQTRGI